jgi:hypothetical protein
MCSHLHPVLTQCCGCACCHCRTGATAATWSLQRLDALAADVIDVLQHDHPETLESSDSSSSSSSARDISSEEDSGSGSSSSVAQQSSTAATARPRVLSQKYPMQVLGAVNSVLFGRQGYAACNRYGTPSDSQLATVLESGPGSCAALTVLYLEVGILLCLTLTVTLSVTALVDLAAVPASQQ